MQVSVTFRHMEATDALKEYAEEKIEKALKKFLKTPFDAHVVLSTERHQHLCDVTVVVSGQTIKGSEKSEDMYTSIDKTGDKIARQLIRYKDKLRDHKSSHNGPMLKEPDAVLSLLEQNDQNTNSLPDVELPTLSPGPKLVKSETLTLRPMTVDQAVHEMDNNNRPFYLFSNAESHEISILYRREDGKYELYDTKPLSNEQ